MRFRKKPVIVEAVLWNGEYSEGVYNFIDFIVIEGREKICPQCKTPLSKHGRIDTLECLPWGLDYNRCKRRKVSV